MIRVGKMERNKGRFGKMGTVAACVLAVVFFCLATVGLVTLDARINTAIDYPYAVTLSVNKVTKAVSEMRIRIEEVVAHPDAVDSAEVNQKIAEKVPILEENITTIREKYLGSEDDVEEMETLVDEIYHLQQEVLLDPRDMDANLASLDDLMPLYGQFLQVTDRIAESSQRMIVGLGREADTTMQGNIVLMVVLVGVMLFISIYYQLRVDKKQRENEQYEQELRDTLELVNRANSAKKEFLSHMSHEIRTPLNTIIGMTAIAVHSIQDPDKLKQCFEKIAYASRHLLQLINDILDMSAIESGKINVGETKFDLKDILGSIADIFYEQCRKKGVKFEATLLGVTAEKLKGDSMRLNQILMNLLSNAVKFTPSGGEVRMTVTQKKIQNSKTTLCFEVEDTGIGMEEGFRGKIFEAFAQEKDTAAKYGGSGLGMAITKNLVEMMGGSIQVESSPGQGSKFTVILPFLLDEMDVEPKKTIPDLGILHILVVDDDEITCEHAHLMLKQMGIEAQWVLSGAEAVKKVLEAHTNGKGFDVCIIDWKMPDMSGVETARKIREIVGEDTLIIIISAYDWTEIEQEARSAGVNAFISKPMFASSVYDTLVTVLERKISPTKTEAVTQPPMDGFAGRTILLAEDNEINREIVEELLSYTGIAVTAVKDGKEALENYIEKPAGTFDAILMDVQMPNMDGYTATREIRNSGKQDAQEIPIIALTANAFTEDIIASRKAGMNDHISKPIELESMLQTLGKYLK